MTNAQLKPCPFCGGNANVGEITEGSEFLRGFIVECEDCTANVDRLDSEEAAMDVWNRRTTLSAADAA
jgi:Lar family restriction alleviation protein